jgi:AraC family transcriptional regulator
MGLAAVPTFQKNVFLYIVVVRFFVLLLKRGTPMIEEVCRCTFDRRDIGLIPESDRLTFDDHATGTGIAFLRGTFQATAGMHVAAPQVSVVIHCGEGFRVDWRCPGSDQLRSRVFSGDHAHVVDMRDPTWFRSYGTGPFFAVAMDEGFVRQIWQEAFGAAGNFELQSALGVHDQLINGIEPLGRSELNRRGAGGRLFAEGLATMLAVHLLRHYGGSDRALLMYKGGLAPRVLRRVLDHIDDHLHDELGLGELAQTAGLGTHHFATAFKRATGQSPHRYVIGRRVARAKELLRDNDLTLAGIAYAVGFSSQSHFTTNFRRVTGSTPWKFRQSVE